MIDLYGTGIDIRHVDSMEGRVLPWVAAKGDSTLRLNYPLNRLSLVFDIGGFRGDWAREIDKLYGCRINVYEPIASFAKEISEEFENNPNIKVYAYGLGSKKRQEKISIDNEASSVFKSGNQVETILIKDVFESIGSKIVDLMKMNIEGGEYELLNRLVASGQIQQIKHIQIQFHDFVRNAEKRYKSIYTKLSRTHHLTYHYPFIWESWSINE